MIAELIVNKLKELYSIKIEKPRKILEIFNDFYGEDKVDLQGFELQPIVHMVNIEYLNSYCKKDFFNDSSLNWDDIKLKKLWELEFIEENVLNRILRYLLEVHLPNGQILVYFPSVKVTNEYDKYVFIDKLYVKINLSKDGILLNDFSMNRAEYTYAQLNSNYMHSHVSGIPYDFEQFQFPCTGTGPIKDTMKSLQSEYNEDLWQLFCLELSKYVSVESVEGGPYHKLENIGVGDDYSILEFNFDYLSSYCLYRFKTSSYTRILKEFTDYIIDNKLLKFSYGEHGYGLGMSKEDCIITLSNAFIEWYNNHPFRSRKDFNIKALYDDGIIDDYFQRNNIFYRYKNNVSYPKENIKNIIGKKICIFKGKDILLNIKEIKEDNYNVIKLINYRILNIIISKILYLINYKYGKPEFENITTDTSIEYL